MYMNFKMSDCRWLSKKINDENPAVRCVVTEGELEIVLEIHRDGSPWSGSNEDKEVCMFPRIIDSTKVL